MGRPHQLLDVRLANNGYFLHSRNFSTPPPLRLNGTTTTATGSHESTRVQLQRQRLRESEHAIVVSSSSVPGLKTGASFFASLRTNLRLNASPPPSPMSTPPSMRASTGTLPPPSPLSVAMDPTEDQSDTLTTQPEDQNDATTTEPEDPLADIPELHTYVATDQEERTAALRLVADSIAQMRQAANNSLIFNPLNMAILVAVFAVVARFMIGRGHEPFIVGTTCTGILCIELVLIRNLTQEYLSAAEEINWAWLGDADLIVTKFGDEIIGTAVVNWVSGESRQKRKKAWRGEIRSWTVRLRYRGKGVGTALLEQAIKESKSKGAEGIDFADYHANSKRVTPKFYSGKFDKADRRARAKLQDMLETSPTKTRRKRGGSS